MARQCRLLRHLPQLSGGYLSKFRTCTGQFYMHRTTYRSIALFPAEQPTDCHPTPSSPRVFPPACWVSASVAVGVAGQAMPRPGSLAGGAEVLYTAPPPDRSCDRPFLPACGMAIQRCNIPVGHGWPFTGGGAGGTTHMAPGDCQAFFAVRQATFFDDLLGPVIYLHSYRPGSTEGTLKSC